MCTLILGRDVLGASSVILAANRDEDPSRASDPPLVLSASPRVVGGRDRVAGGTWLAVRGREAVVALLNRRPAEGAARPAGPLRSRGLLTLEAARVVPIGGTSLADAIAEHVRVSVARAPYAPFSMVIATREACAWWRGVPDEPVPFRPIGPGWHVITHEDLDDMNEPRTAWLLDELSGFAPRDPAEAAEGLLAKLRLHAGDGNRAPAVCIHEGLMRTVSASALWLVRGETRYLHIEGRPCEGAAVEHTSLLAGVAPAGEIS